VATGSKTIVVFLALGVLQAVPAAAQNRPSPAVEFAAGSLLFADDGIVPEGFAGGAARVYLSPRISIGPEISMVWGQRHSHVIATGNLTIDLVVSLKDRPRAVTPFVVVGGGLFRTNEEFPFTSFSSTEGAFTVGGGIRVAIGQRAFAGGEARLGWEAHFRLSGSIGVQFGK
jgi:hypothetical protein